VVKVRRLGLCCVAALVLLSAVDREGARAAFQYAIIVSTCDSADVACDWCLTSVNSKKSGGWSCYLNRCDTSDARFKTCQQAASPKAKCYQKSDVLTATCSGCKYRWCDDVATGGAASGTLPQAVPLPNGVCYCYSTGGWTDWGNWTNIKACSARSTPVKQ